MSGQTDTSQLYEKVAFARLLDLRREFAEDGVSRMVLDTKPELTNNFDNTHGGVIMTMLDMAMSSAALSKSGFTKAVITVDMSTQFLKPGLGRLTAHGRAVGGGKSICFCEAHIEDASGRMVARSIGTFKYVEPRRP
ncbi:MAG: PaaI family thioesterase [Serpentinimonas sp.]|nr:PaaI family thioesterase [Serpentinimonas sp.]MDO9612191.1 PaaI family thioesterase [Serpentinimonas sp.]